MFKFERDKFPLLTCNSLGPRILIRVIESGKYKESGLAVGICSYSQVLKRNYADFFPRISRITVISMGEKNRS